MAYPAVISLKQTIHHLLYSSHISILSPTRQTLQDAHKQLTFMQQSLTRPIDINCGSKKRSKELEKNYIEELEKPNSEEDNSAEIVTNSAVKMVGLSDAIADMKDHLLRITRPDYFGCAGNMSNQMFILFRDGWCSTDQKSMSSEVKLGQHLVASMRGRRYIVALDDVRDTEILARLRSWLPEQNNGSIVLVTTGMAEVTEFDESFFLFEILVVLNEAINWRCIKGLIESRGWVVTAAFEEAGKKIVGNCGGFRIVVAKVMVALLRSEKSLNLWNKLAQIKMIPFSRLMMRYWR
ncbi:hypothetical protein SASPL_115042 [Salvia splendens]|uniref:NB-ARC domain-containing protein n=2 Tax=Salvia splendens TaxID=180675 RepID=A0A8X8Y4G1_SALSN|nr:hypothetical protein SASPL_115042 [Salvia splendens]